MILDGNTMQIEKYAMLSLLPGSPMLHESIDTTAFKRAPLCFYDWTFVPELAPWLRKLSSQNLCYFEYRTERVRRTIDSPWITTNVLDNVLFVNESDYIAAKLKFNLW